MALPAGEPENRHKGSEPSEPRTWERHEGDPIPPQQILAETEVKTFPLKDLKLMLSIPPDFSTALENYLLH